MENKIWSVRYTPQSIDMNPPCGTSYGVPQGLSNDEMNAFVHEFMVLAKTKKLTTRQIQYIFNVCADRVLDFTFD